jgi:hypothetical protein
MRRMTLVTLALVLVLPLAVVGTARAHNWYPDDGCRPGLSSDSYFWAAGPAANWGVYGGGWNGCHLETWTNTTGTVNWAEWYLPISTLYDHSYFLQPYVSSGGPQPYTSQAIYRAWCCGHDGGISFVGALDQNANQGSFCYTLGSRIMYGSVGGLMDAVDYNSYGDGYLYVDLFCFNQ